MPYDRIPMRKILAGIPKNPMIVATVSTPGAPTCQGGGAPDAQSAADLYSSSRTVRSHLDRIRDKTSCRRRADLTRLALTAGLV